MTLNITVVSPVGIHQSADFQISRTETDANGNWIELQQNSSKIVSLRYKKWSGFLTYCGIGLWRGKRTDEYAAEWLSQLSDPGTTFRDAVEKIREQGTGWLASINRSFGKIQRHSFVIAGYEEGIPVYAIVSDYQTLTGHITPISNELKVDFRRSSSGIHIFVTGIRDAVPKTRTRLLRRIAQTGNEANVIRHELAKTNRMAAQSPAAKNGISAACLTYSVDQHGGGSGEVHGEVSGPLMPRTISHGIDLTKMLAQVVGGGKFVKGAFVTGQSNEATIREHIDCELRFKGAPEEPNSPQVATVEEVGAINDYWLSMHGVNNSGFIVGQFRNPFQASPQAFIWPPGQGIRNLGTLGGPTSSAVRVNDINQVVGSADRHDSASHAFLWDDNIGTQDLGTLGGRVSFASSINNSSHVVGYSYVDPGEPRQEAQRAFLWTPADGMKNLGNLFDGWSRAIAINNAGVLLGWRLRNGIVCGFVWSLELGVINIVNEGGRPFFPSAINDSGLVVGEGDDSSGKRRAFGWTHAGGLRKLAVPDDFHPFDVDVGGTVIGTVYSHPWQRPYLYNIVTTKSLPLPFVEAHHTSVNAINNHGLILGAASTASWKHSHPLLWHLNLDPALFD